MLTIRLSRVGKRKQPTYRLIVLEKSKDPWGDCLEIFGHLNPRAKDAKLILKEDRLRHWLSKGAQLSDTVHNLLIAQGLIKGEKRRIVKLSQKKQGAIAAGKIKEAEAEVKKAEVAAKLAEAKPTETMAEPNEPAAEPAI